MSQYEQDVVDGRSFEQCFPDIDPGVEPKGNRIVVQLRSPVTMSKSGIVYVPETKQTMRYGDTIAIVKAIGPLAYKMRDENGQIIPWGEGPWVQVGDIVRSLKWGGDRWSVPHGDDYVNFIITNDKDVIAVVKDFRIAQSMKSFVE